MHALKYKIVCGIIFFSDRYRFNQGIENPPKGIKQTTSTWEGCYEIDLRELLGL